MAARVQAFQKTKAQMISPLEREYSDALDVLDGYTRLSPYLGMDPDQAKSANRLIARARDRMRLLPGINQNVAILLDPEADAGTKSRALMASGGKMSNPLRKHYWTQNRSVLGKFFSELGSDEVAELAA